MKLLTLLLTLAVTTSLNAAEVKSDNWKTKLESIIQQYDKNGMVNFENGTYVYRYHTLIYKFHPITTKAGDTSGETYNQEGPKDDGIFLQVMVRDGVYQGQLEIPQEIKVPFWRTFINAYPITGDKYLMLSLSYGIGSDKKLIEDLKICFGPIIPPPAKIPRFGLYLVTKDAIELDRIKFTRSPLLTEDDIIDYNWTDHTMYITETAERRIPTKVGVSGIPFVIAIDGKPAYRGAFWNSLSSISCPYPVINVFDIYNSQPRTTVKIYRQYPNRSDQGIGPDPRDNDSVKKVLRELGKLTEK
jgi:hypothetical protein